MNSLAAKETSILLDFLRDQECRVDYEYSADFKERIFAELSILCGGELSEDELKMKSHYPLHFAADGNLSITIINEIIRLYPGHVDNLDFNNKLPVHYALRRCASREVVQALFTGTHAQKEFYETVRMGRKSKPPSPLILAITTSTDENIEVIFSACPELASLPDRHGRLPLHYLALRGLNSKRIACLLNSSGAVVTSKDEQNQYVVRNRTSWRSGDEDGGPGCLGNIIRTDEGYVRVFWLLTGKVGVYKFGFGEVWEVISYEEGKKSVQLCLSGSTDGGSVKENKKLRSKSFVLSSPPISRRSSTSSDISELRAFKESEDDFPLDASCSSLSPRSDPSSPRKCAGLNDSIHSLGSFTDENFVPTESAVVRTEIFVDVCKTFPGACTMKDNRGRLPLHYACRNNISKEALNILLEL